MSQGIDRNKASYMKKYLELNIFIYMLSGLFIYIHTYMNETNGLQVIITWKTSNMYLITRINSDQIIQSHMVSQSHHDDVIKWKHFPRYWPFVRGIHQSPVNSPYKGQWRGALMFSLICVWINDWVNNREAGDLRRHRTHNDATVMQWVKQIKKSPLINFTGGWLVSYYHSSICFIKMNVTGGDKRW